MMVNIMKRKFKSKKKFKINYLLYLILICLAFYLIFNTILKNKKVNTNKQFVMSLLQEANYPTMKKKQKVFNYISNLVTNIDTSKPLT